MNAKRRVLIVDDNAVLATVMTSQLRSRSNYEVRSETDSRRALATGRKFRPHCVVLDIVMPDTNGPEVAQQFRRDPQLRDVDIVFLTAMVTPNEARARRSQPVPEPIFAKPVDLKELITHIESQPLPVAPST